MSSISCAFVIEFDRRRLKHSFRVPAMAVRPLSRLRGRAGGGAPASTGANGENSPPRRALSSAIAEASFGVSKDGRQRRPMLPRKRERWSRGDQLLREVRCQRMIGRLMEED